METNSPDKMSMRVWLILAVLGAVLCIVGWYRFLSSKLTTRRNPCARSEWLSARSVRHRSFRRLSYSRWRSA